VQSAFNRLHEQVTVSGNRGAAGTEGESCKRVDGSLSRELRPGLGAFAPLGATPSKAAYHVRALGVRAWACARYGSSVLLTGTRFKTPANHYLRASRGRTGWRA
jgi:hypothetical protein